MTRERWERLKPLFQGALEQSPSDRAEWLRRACPDDEALRREAQALVDAHDTAGGFLDSPAALDTSLAAPDDEEPLHEGQLLGPYRVRGELGRGGMGIVYLAEDIRLGRTVALKALPAFMAGDEQRRERLRREARAAAALTHPGIAVVYALEEFNGQLFIASEHVKGHTLTAELADGPLGPVRALATATDIVQALCAAHDAGIVHRDLKPDNILRTHDGRIKILDFGIAHFADSPFTQLTMSGAILGTPAYMAPEQLIGGAADARVDVYAMGVLLVEMATGAHPFATGDDTSGLSQLNDYRSQQACDPDSRAATTPGSPPRLRGGVGAARPVPFHEIHTTRTALPPALQTIADRCLAQNPRDRYPSARELLSALESVSLDAADLPRPRLTPRWWWEFHQGVAALVYWLMAIPAWRAKAAIGGLTGRVTFIVLLTAIIVAANLRLHLWFTSRFYPRELGWVRARTAAWVTAADWVFAITLVAAGVLVHEVNAPLATLLQGVGIGSAVAFLVIEPVTERAAFRDPVP